VHVLGPHSRGVATPCVEVADLLRESETRNGVSCTRVDAERVVAPRLLNEESNGVRRG
jgi:hypothetical protein